jgi:4-hydroxy-tetrahydrodipicolinate synthase
LTSRFYGIHVPTITVFRPDGDVDADAIKALAGRFVEAGASCLVPTANNGEQPHLSVEEKKLVWQANLEGAAGKAAVVPSITMNTTAEVTELAKVAQSMGAAGVMVAPPFYFRLNEAEAYEYYRDIAEAIDIPVMIHNEPGVFKTDITPGLVEKLSRIDNICLIKESTENTQRVHEIIRLCGDRMTVVVAGGGTALESMLLGAKAWMTGLINIIPEIAVEMYNLAVVEGKFDEAKKVYFEKILPVHSLMKEIGRPVPTVKYAVELITGIPARATRKPMLPLAESDMEKVKKTLKEIGVL